MLRRKLALCVFVVALFGMPRTGHAGILELIWELSGPQLIGGGLSCLYSFPKPTLEECRLGSSPTLQAIQMRTLHKRFPLFFVLGGSGFISTPRDTNNNYEWFDVNMVAVDGGLFTFTKPTSLRIGHGAGLSVNHFFGRNFRPFQTFAFTFTPIELSGDHFAIGLKVRLYPDGFTDDQFGFAPPFIGDRPSEVTWGGSFSIVWR